MNKLTKQKGFTIIEVMIVLAIAGLILVVVLIAIPQLQRNQRNEQRRSVASRIVAEINNYAGNNNGVYPVASNVGAAASDAKNFGQASAGFGFFNRYLGCTTGTPPTCTTNVNDPTQKVPVGSDDAVASTANMTTLAGTTPATATPGTVPGSIGYGTGMLCDGEVPTTTGAATRNFVFLMRLEGGATFCLDNR